MSNLPIDFAAITQALETLEMSFETAEAHGAMTGLLAGQAPENSWLLLLTDDLEDITPDEIAKTPEGESLFHLNQHITEQLQSFDFSFQILLPETENLKMQAESLRLWCEGFTQGFTNANQQVLGEDAREALGNISAIVELDASAVDQDKQSEADLTELVEYIRMAALFLYHDMHDAIDEESKPTIIDESQIH